MPIYIKYIITAAIVVVASEVTKLNVKLGALIGALPLVTILVVLWLFTEHKGVEGAEKISSYVYYTFWYVLPTLPMFLVMSSMLKNGGNFWVSLGVYILGTFLLILLLNLVLKRFDINLI